MLLRLGRICRLLLGETGSVLDEMPEQVYGQQLNFLQRSKLHGYRLVDHDELTQLKLGTLGRIYFPTFFIETQFGK